MTLARKVVAGAIVVLISACSGSSASPSAGSVGVIADVASLANNGALAHVTAIVTDAKGAPATGSVMFTASGGSVNGTGTLTATATLDVDGHAVVSYACDVAVDPAHCGAGTVLITAAWSSVTNGTHIALQGAGGSGSDAGTTIDAGTPPDAGPVVVGPVGPPAAVFETAAAPALLGIKGSGIQETGVMSFTVTDASGRGVSGVTVNFAQTQPALVTLANATGVTVADGSVNVSYNAGSQVGISAITATVASTTITGSHPIAVRGAKPSASGFYFRCNRINLPVYTTTLEYETTSCVVRLADRYGNRVGIATPVSFAAEAGAISASAVTKPFDFANPTDPDEGSVTVTFSSDMGTGFSPAETTPFAADPTQFPKPRLAEPFRGGANPRDQLVTIIAMVRGEEAFVDSNLNGQYDPGELFVDQGDPFVDSNDDNLYDPATEPRFCGGADCATYHGPNGVWDSDRTLWVPTWEVFTAVGDPIISAWAPSSCLDYIDNNVANPSLSTATVKVLDPWLNIPTIGTTFSAALTASQGSLKLTTFGGTGAMLDNLGSMDLSWEKVSAANPGLPCTVANTVNGACKMLSEFGGWDDGSTMALEVANSGKTPATAAPGHACGASTAGTHVAGFQVDVSVKGPNASTVGSTGGTYGY
ncbi:MAG TPA: hypothetical protein VFA79_17780 [Myxococcales bacterium]|nr:hypothetical protein [Myxococcales bacterium]